MAGSVLSRAFLVGEAGDALCEAVKEAIQINETLRLALEISDKILMNLPRETLQIPETDHKTAPALALHPHVCLYRSVEVDSTLPAIRIPGPLHILVAIGSSEKRKRTG